MTFSQCCSSFLVQNFRLSHLCFFFFILAFLTLNFGSKSVFYYSEQLLNWLHFRRFCLFILNHRFVIRFFCVGKYSVKRKVFPTNLFVLEI